MNCKVCGSSEFCTTYGITYCTECNSQIEETQTEVNVDLVPSKEFLSSSATKKKTNEPKKYSDWISAEFFNHLIYLQVSSLIKLGASPKLKATVLHIWSKYLQKCEIAFRIDYQADDGIPRLGPVPSQRDIKVLYGDKIMYMPKKNSKKNSKPSTSNVSMEKDDSVSDTDYSSDNTTTESSQTMPAKRKYSSLTRKLYRKSTLKRSNKIPYHYRVFNMTPSKTISMCYLGLLYTEDQLGLIDFIRFIHEDKIPYMDVKNKLPESIKIQHGDASLFKQKNFPDGHKVMKTALEIAHFLKLPKFKNPSVYLAASRLVKDLNLPDDLKPIIKTLSDIYTEKITLKKENFVGIQLNPEISYYIHPDFQALSFIIIALKLLFILDGKFELEHSENMMKLNAIYPEKKYFVWKEWKEQATIKEFLFLNENPGQYHEMNKLDSLSADKIVSKYKFTELKPPSKNVVGYNRMHRLQVARNEIVDILSNIVSVPEKAENEPTSFPLRKETNFFMQEWRTLPMFKETQEIDFSLLQKDFSSCSLHFSPSQFNRDEDELSYLLLTSLYSPENPGNMDFKFKRPSTAVHITETTSKYWYFKSRSSRLCTELSSDWFDKVPSSFKWLLNFMAKYAYCNSSRLFHDVSKIETVLFFEKFFVRKVPKNSKLFLGF